ncbi:hypothetical protein Pmar_PMAR009989 [Perkinsus marinus ATCC 50983]|uniref:Uncharacterized protein n=1 Tax=Perkinsus marinus (strain ATCC 50983 / TXsc) TaxID=423536 RepID=C5L2T2_PERM5|nr:hypothetical protein Pmar_PMAR009989 [Perkinsus marinus ATCC 50983]EER08997.1 hypothetical protein Pmar_PMAR009989 [Perkinsus marinus ATCC 50983]|eukprot:XP_002777181.1 hypothetical protein Pmar_PMAR009989 [Perkinsus marinus ATCC 50983]
MDAAPGPDAAASDDDDGHEAFEKYRNPRDSTATLPSPKESSVSIHNTRTDKEEVDDREVASNGLAASSPAGLDIDGWRLDSDDNSDAGRTEPVEKEIENARKQGEAKEDVVAGLRKRKTPPLQTEEREMMEIAQHRAARVRERSRTERYRRKTLVAKAADTPITAGILPCSTTKLTMPREPKLHTTARAAGSGQTPRMETPTDGADQVDGLAVAAERFSSRLREASNPRWTGKPTVSSWTVGYHPA